MTKRKTIKEKITEVVIAELPPNLLSTVYTSGDDIILKWWMTGKLAGMRLTEIGNTAFKLAQMEYYDLDFTLGKSGLSWYKILMELNHKISCPYYLGVRKQPNDKRPYIRLYDSRVAMMVNLYGNIQDYLESINLQKR